MEPGQVSSVTPSAARRRTRAGSSMARTPWPMRVTGRVSRAARTLSAPATSPAWTVRPRPASAAMAKARAKSDGGPVALLAGHAEAGDGRPGGGRSEAGGALGAVGAEVADRHRDEAGFDAGGGRGGFGDGGEVVGPSRRVAVGAEVGREEDLGVDDAVGGGLGQHRLGQAAVVVGGREDGAGGFVGAQELGEVVPGVVAVRRRRRRRGRCVSRRRGCG